MNDDMEHAETTDEPDPAALASFQAKHPVDEATANGEAAGGPVEASYDIPPPPTPEEAQKAAEARPCLTAFMVVVEADGTAWATNDINLLVDPARPPGMGDMYRSCAEVMKDIEGIEVAQRTVNMLAQVWPQIAANQQEQERQAKIATRLMQKGIHVPGRA